MKQRWSCRGLAGKSLHGRSASVDLEDGSRKPSILQPSVSIVPGFFCRSQLKLQYNHESSSAPHISVPPTTRERREGLERPSVSRWSCSLWAPPSRTRFHGYPFLMTD
ncbi:hypothetical protein FQA47_015217 [Oryzias melastigma]|uniref:Uncharacterized protein n=1 Tax=Oryzias melastigma TaxID=30732 RepID=A0A834CKI4_ORYME|nr:hypothetical protein FQA47_015217 [Oryzias melastigma]